MKCETCSSSASSAATGACRDTVRMYFLRQTQTKLRNVNVLLIMRFPMVCLKPTESSFVWFDLKQRQNVWKIER